jgi:radical SAM protein with 4Fe4S-binding SPASM domain
MCIRGNAAGLDMDYNECVKFLPAKVLSGKQTVITGGEPTLHDSFCDFVRRASLYSDSVAVTTNGTTDYYIDDLSKIDNLRFQVSLDGDAETNDSIRGEGAYAQIESTLNKMNEKGLKFSVASVVGKKNIDAAEKIIPFLSSLKNMSYWRLSLEMPFGKSGFKDILEASEWNDFADHIISKANFRVKIQKIFPFDLCDAKLKAGLKAADQNERSFNCGSGRDKIYVYPDFTVYSCTCLTDFPLGNLKNESLGDILYGQNIKKFSEYEVEKGGVCHNCKYLKICNGGCIGISYHYFGALGKGDARCPILKDYHDQKNFLL